MITLYDYIGDKRTKNPSDYTPEVEKSAEDLIHKVNYLLTFFKVDRPDFIVQMSSGWRPKTYNDKIPNAAKKSNHITGKAVDIADLNKALGGWCITHTDILEKCGLWIENPQATATWVHFQTVPPKSGRRIFNP